MEMDSFIIFVLYVKVGKKSVGMTGQGNFGFDIWNDRCYMFIGFAERNIYAFCDRNASKKNPERWN